LHRQKFGCLTAKPSSFSARFKPTSLKREAGSKNKTGSQKKKAKPVKQAETSKLAGSLDRFVSKQASSIVGTPTTVLDAANNSQCSSKHLGGHIDTEDADLLDNDNARSKFVGEKTGEKLPT